MMEKQINISTENSRSVPKLRFPEFTPDWELNKLGDLFVNRRERGNKSLPIFSVTQNSGLVSRSSLDRSIGKDAEAQDNLYAEPYDLVYNMMRMWQGAIGIANQACMVSPAYVVLKPVDNVNSLFFIYLFERIRSKYLFTAYSYGLTSDRLRLYFKDFSAIKFPTPSFSEQTRIASFFTVLEKKVAELKQKKSLLEQYKKGVMQKLFSQELRFKDENENEFPEWEKLSFGKLYSFKTRFQEINSTMK